MSSFLRVGRVNDLSICVPSMSLPTPPLAELQPGDDALLAIEILADLQLQNLELDDEDTDSFVFGSDDEEDSPCFPALYAAIAGPRGTVGRHGDNEPIVRALLHAEPAAVNLHTVQGWTPLMVSGSTGQPGIMRLLLRHGANPDDRDTAGNSVADWTRHCVKGFDDDIVLEMELHDGHRECLAILEAVEQLWSPASHALYPHWARERCVELLRLGYLLSLQPRGQPEGAEPPIHTLGRGFADVWVAAVLPLAVERAPLAPPWWHLSSISESASTLPAGLQLAGAEGLLL